MNILLDFSETFKSKSKKLPQPDSENLNTDENYSPNTNWARGLSSKTVADENQSEIVDVNIPRDVKESFDYISVEVSQLLFHFCDAPLTFFLLQVQQLRSNTQTLSNENHTLTVKVESLVKEIAKLTSQYNAARQVFKYGIFSLKT